MKKRRQNKRVKALRRVTAAALLLALVITWVSLDSWFGFTRRDSSVRVTIPNFCGERYDELAFEAWQTVTTEYRYDPNVPAGTVFAQSPSAGSVRKLSSERATCHLTLTVSLGDEQVTAQNVIGMDVREAMQRLRSDGFAVETVMQTGPYPEGRVLAMTPDGILPRGSRITLTVSAGEPVKTVEVPDVTGLSRSDALVQLWLSQLAVGEVIEEPSNETPGTVIKQSHQPGTVVMAGTKIKLYISAEE